MDVRPKEESTSIFDEIDKGEEYKELLEIEVVLPTDFIYSLIDIAIKNGGMSFNECLNILDFFYFLDFVEWLTRTRREAE